jgi:hypothetical protein
MSGLEAVLAFAGTAVSAAQSITAANNQAKLASHDAQVAEQNAQLAERQAATDAARQRRDAARALGKRRTATGAAGVSIEGSPLDLLEDLAAESALEVLGIRNQGALRARDFRIGAERTQFQARAGKQQAALGAASTLLSGGGKLVGSLRSAPKVGRYSFEQGRPFPGDPD